MRRKKVTRYAVGDAWREIMGCGDRFCRDPVCRKARIVVSVLLAAGCAERERMKKAIFNDIIMHGSPIMRDVHALVVFTGSVEGSGMPDPGALT